MQPGVGSPAELGLLESSLANADTLTPPGFVNLLRSGSDSLTLEVQSVPLGHGVTMSLLFNRQPDIQLNPRFPLRGIEETSFFFFLIIYFYIYFWLCYVFVSVQGLSLVVASGGHSSSRCAGLSLSRPLLLRSTGSRRAGSVVVAHGPSCSAACGILPDQGSNPCPLHWQADSQPLCHQGSP